MKTLGIAALLTLLAGCVSSSAWHDDAGHTIVCSTDHTLANVGSLGACEAAAISRGYHQ